MTQHKQHKTHGELGFIEIKGMYTSRGRYQESEKATQMEGYMCKSYI